jgi:hypothetical protein
MPAAYMTTKIDGCQRDYLIYYLLARLRLKPFEVLKACFLTHQE